MTHPFAIIGAVIAALAALVVLMVISWHHNEDLCASRGMAYAPTGYFITCADRAGRIFYP